MRNVTVKSKCSKCGADLVCYCPVCAAVASSNFGAMGGKKASKRMTVKQRKERARKAALARWESKRGRLSELDFHNR
jgi:hypothetical protein